MKFNIKDGKRAYAGAHFGLSFDDNANKVGLFRSVEGGGVTAEVMTHKHGASYERWRQLGKPKFDDLKLEVGMAMSKPFYQWIQSFFDGKVVRKTGAIMAADFRYMERARRHFEGAMITELTFPKLEGGDKTPAYMTVGIAVEHMTYHAGDGRIIAGPDGSGFNQQKSWTCDTFEVTIDGYDDCCENITKVESFTIKQNVVEYHAGHRRTPIKCATQIEFPLLSFTFPEPDSHPLVELYKQRGIDGQLKSRLHGHIQTFDPSGNPLFLLEFYDADISAVRPDRHDATSDAFKQVKLDLHPERMSFRYLAAPVGSIPHIPGVPGLSMI